MKVLRLKGAPAGINNRFEQNEVVVTIQMRRIGLFTGKKLPKVRPAKPTYETLAETIQKRIDARIQLHPDAPFVYHAGTEEHPHRRKVAALTDPNVLEAIRVDAHLWSPEIAGYYILPTYSKVEDK